MSIHLLNVVIFHSEIPISWRSLNHGHKKLGIPEKNEGMREAAAYGSAKDRKNRVMPSNKLT